MSYTYKTINDIPDSLTRLRVKWKSELGELDDTDGEVALMHPRRGVVIKSRLRLVQFKILH